MKFYLPSEICPRLVELQKIGPIDVTIHYLQRQRSECWYWLGDDIDHKGRYDDRQGMSQPDPEYVKTELERKGYSPVQEEIVSEHFIVREYTLKPEIPVWFLELNELAKEAQKPILRLDKDVPLYSTIYEPHEFGRYSEKAGQRCCWDWQVVGTDFETVYLERNSSYSSRKKLRAKSFDESVTISVQKQDKVKIGSPEIVSTSVKRTVYTIDRFYSCEPYGELLGKC